MLKQLQEKLIKRYTSLPSAALSGLLLVAAFSLITLALFEKSVTIKAIALAYVVLP